MKNDVLHNDSKTALGFVYSNYFFLCIPLTFSFSNVYLYNHIQCGLSEWMNFEMLNMNIYNNFTNCKYPNWFADTIIIQLYAELMI